MIDLHSHILPGVDDGARTTSVSLAMARLAVADGIHTMLATPHVSLDFDFDYAELPRRVEDVNIALARAKVPLAVLKGGEVALSRLLELSYEDLRRLCLGDSRAVLVESPYVEWSGGLEQALFDLQARGFRPVLAHPERCPSFQRQIDRLGQLVERGVLCSVNAASMAGDFGSTVQRCVVTLFSESLVHSVASDAHDLRRRPPRLNVGFEEAESELPGISKQIAWFTHAVPEAILAQTSLPPRPEPLAAKRRLRRRLRRHA